MRLYFIKFAQVSDPHGLAAIVKSLKKQQAKLQISSPVQDNAVSNQSETPLVENTLHEDNTSSIEKTFPTREISPTENTPHPTEVARYTSIQCRHNNPVGSKFCNKCASQLLPLCTKCGSSNPSDANFCNQCGSKIEL